MQISSIAIFLWMVSSLGCSIEVARDLKGIEVESPIDGRFDSFRSLTDHGTLNMGEPVEAILTRDEPVHTWVFALSDDATLALSTFSEHELDTVLYLYRMNSQGFGQAIARNDDHGDAASSLIVQDLPSGTYRALVKGYDLDAQGRFTLASECEGVGCAHRF